MIFSGNEENLIAFKSETDAIMFACDFDNIGFGYTNITEETAKKEYPQYRKVANDYPPRTIVNRAGIAVGRA